MDREVTQTKSRASNMQFYSRLLFVVLWTQDTVMLYMSQLFRRVPLLGQFHQYFTPLLLLVLFVFAFFSDSRKIKAGDMLFVSLIVVIIFGTMIIFPENTEHIEKKLSTIVLSVLPMYLYGLYYDHHSMKHDLYVVSVTVVVVQMIHLFFLLYARDVQREDNMHAAYTTLPSIMYILYWTVEKKKVFGWIMTVASLLLLFAYGTRGPIVAVVLYAGVLVFFRAGKKRSIFRIFVLVILILLIVPFLSSDMFLNSVERLSDFFGEQGFSTRIFDKFLGGELADDSGRSYISTKIGTAINENWLFGLGFMGDRTVLDGSYAHNIFLELICSFGIFVGTIIIIFLLSLTLSTLRKTYLKPEFHFAALIITFVFTKLMFSWSYAIEPYFYFMIGVCISMTRKYNGKTVEKDETIKKNH